ncbi:MAG: hypothetical protein Q8K92_20180, partial [Leadbetterella sp.]|nr:hypothetical protein [Leadbetterella sp.]
AFSMMVDDYLLDEGDVVLGNGAISISQGCGHAVLHNRNLMRTHGFFQGKNHGERVQDFLV